MKGKTEKILCGFSSIFPKYLGKYARKMRAGRYETDSEGKFASRWRAKPSGGLCAVLPKDNTALFAEHNGFQQQCPFLCGKGIVIYAIELPFGKLGKH